MLKISGPSTPHIFKRYKIIGESDLHEAVKREVKAENRSEVVQLVAQRTLTPLILVRVQASEPNPLQFSLTVSTGAGWLCAE